MGKWSDVSLTRTATDSGSKELNMLSISECVLSVTRVGIVTAGYRPEPAILFSKSAASAVSGILRLILKSHMRISSFF